MNNTQDENENQFQDTLMQEDASSVGELPEEEEPKKKEKKGLFDREHPMNVFLAFLGSLVLTNIYFVVCSLPVVTMGASLTAMNKVCYMLRTEGDIRVTKLFFKTFVSNLLDGILSWIVSAGILSACIFGLYTLMTQGVGSTPRALLAGLCGLGGILVLVEIAFCYGLMFRYENHALTHMKNGLLIGLGNLGWTLVILLMWGLVIAIYVLIPGVLLYGGWLMLMVGFSFLAYQTSRIYGRIFKKIEKDK